MTSRSPPAPQRCLSSAPVAEELNDFPACLRDTETYPWEGEEPICWPFGIRAGTPLQDFSSATLLHFRGIVARKNGRGSYFKPLLDAIDAVLFERGGEL